MFPILLFLSFFSVGILFWVFKPILRWFSLGFCWAKLLNEYKNHSASIIAAIIDNGIETHYVMIQLERPHTSNIAADHKNTSHGLRLFVKSVSKRSTEKENTFCEC